MYTPVPGYLLPKNNKTVQQFSQQFHDPVLTVPMPAPSKQDIRLQTLQKPPNINSRVPPVIAQPTWTLSNIERGGRVVPKSFQAQKPFQRSPQQIQAPPFMRVHPPLDVWAHHGGRRLPRFSQIKLHQDDLGNHGGRLLQRAKQKVTGHVVVVFLDDIDSLEQAAMFIDDKSAQTECKLLVGYKLADTDVKVSRKDMQDLADYAGVPYYETDNVKSIAKELSVK